MKESIVTRIGLTPAELRQVRRISAETGVPISRLLADAVRAELLTPKGKAA